MDTKNELRKKANKIRSSLDIKAISEKIVLNIKASKEYQHAEHIMIFFPLGHEVNLLGLLTDDKKFYLPKVNGEELLVCPYKAGDKLILSAFKTEEPLSESVNPDVLEVVFVPALMVDKHKNRLGYGGGFYDKFLSRNCAKALKIVAIPSALIIDELPSEDFDEKIDVTVCEKN